MNNLAAVFASLLLLVVPLDSDIKTELKNDYCSVETTCKVTKVGDNYIYLYSIKNNSKNKVKVNWGVLNRALNQGQDIEMIWDLNADENLNFVVEHASPPLQVGGIIKAQSLVNKKDFDKFINDMPKSIKIDMPQSKFYRVDSIYMSGTIPQAFVGRR